MLRILRMDAKMEVETDANSRRLREPLLSTFADTHWLRCWTAAFVVIGLVERTVRYLLQFPYWGDEAFVGLNLMDQTYIGFFQGLKYVQVAPLLFLWSELTAFQWLGGGELALRMLPFVAGVSGLVLFWRLSRQLLPAASSMLAIALMSVSRFPIRHTCEVKPYSLDLLCSVVLLLLAADFLRRPNRMLPLILLCCGIPLMLGFSYPAVFVAGGVSVAMLPKVWGQSKSIRCLWLLYNGLLVGAFCGNVTIAGFLTSTSDLHAMHNFWNRAFPPSNLLEFPKWFLLTHTGSLMAYPIGDKNGGSTLTFILVVAGIWHASRSRSTRQILWLCLPPFGLTFLAACVHRFPYGDSARVNQHLAPMICILAALGIEGLIRNFARNPSAQRNCVRGWAIALLLFAVGTLLVDLFRPYKTETARESRRVAHAVAASADGDPIILMNDPDMLGCNFYFYLKLYSAGLLQNTDLAAQACAGNRRVLGLRAGHNQLPTERPLLPGKLSETFSHAGQVERYSFPMQAYKDLNQVIEVIRWERPASPDQ